MLTPGRVRKSARTAKRNLSFPLSGLIVLGCLALAGCGTWDDFRSRDYSVQSYFVEEDPIAVLRETQDGDRRARALGNLREPKQEGGTDQEQEYVVLLLTQAASREPQALCRLRAVEALGRFKDPRAVSALVDAYYNAKDFTPEMRTVLRCQALSALGQTGNPEAINLLVTVLQEPPVETSKTPEQDRQHKLDERLAAARALANFNDYRATEALVQVLRKERDVALRGRARESLQVVTGQDLPADADAWDRLLYPSRAGGDTVAEKGDAPKAVILPARHTSTMTKDKGRRTKE